MLSELLIVREYFLTDCKYHTAKKPTSYFPHEAHDLCLPAQNLCSTNKMLNLKKQQHDNYC